MDFRPQAGDQLNIEETLCTIAEDPYARGLPFAQEGREGVVYQLLSPHHEKLALKVFKEEYRTSVTVTRRAKMLAFASLPALQICQSSVLTANSHADLLLAHPALAYSVLMPWIDGPTWQTKIRERQPLAQAQSLFLARTLASNLAAMEKQGLAHCALSGANLMIPYLFKTVTVNQPLALVDVEQLYGPDLPQPVSVLTGYPGYTSSRQTSLAWSADGDRFAGAILLAEILCWSDPEICRQAAGESYFAPEEIQRTSQRYDLLQSVLVERWGKELAALFERVWKSSDLAGCPSAAEWLANLPEKISTVRAILEAEVVDSRGQNLSGLASNTHEAINLSADEVYDSEATVVLKNSSVCPQCHKKVTGGWINCPFCGAPLLEAANDTPTDSPPKVEEEKNNPFVAKQASVRNDIPVQTTTKNKVVPDPAPAGPAVFAAYRKSESGAAIPVTAPQKSIGANRKILIPLSAMLLLVFCGGCAGLSYFIYNQTNSPRNVAAVAPTTITTLTATAPATTPDSLTAIAVIIPTLASKTVTPSPITSTETPTLTPVLTSLPTVTSVVTDTPLSSDTAVPTDTLGPNTAVPTKARPTRVPTATGRPAEPPTNTPNSTARFPAASYKLTVAGNGKALEDPNYSGANNTNMTLAGWTGGQNQQWAIDALGNGFYRIINKYSGKVLDDPGGSGANETFIMQHDWNSGANQQWSIIYQNNGYFAILNRASGKALEDWRSAGTSADQYDWHGGLNQLWQVAGL